MNFVDSFQKIFTESGFAAMTWQSAVMILVSFVLIYLAIVKKFEPLLLLPIAFGVLLTNLPLGELIHMNFFSPYPEGVDPATSDVVYATMENGHLNIPFGEVLRGGGILDILYLGVKLGLYPSLIFMGVGAMTDFGPLIARPSSLLMGAGAQFGIAIAFIIAIALGFTPQEAGSIGIIGGADGPTAIYLTTKLAPHLLAAIAIAAYSYMALIPLIQPPIMRLLTTEKERKIKMKQLRPVSKLEKVAFAVIVTILCTLLLPSVAPLIGMLMLGNIFRESGVVDRLTDTATNALINIVTIFLGVTVGSTAVGANFLSPQTLKIIILGLVAFMFGTVGGLLIGKLMSVLSGGKINPLIGSAGVSAVPMAARVSQVEGQKANPKNYLLMFAMGPNVAGVIGSAVAAGVLLTLFG
jgi:oxaloacetate decarboxylase beta subunit